MKQSTIDALEKCKALGLLVDYALGGGVAVKYYVNPPATDDVDFFVIVKSSQIDFMQPVYDWFTGNGGRWVENKHMLFNGELIDILPAWGLGEEAVKNASSVTIDNIKVKIIKPDYLAAILYLAGRPHDILRIQLMMHAGVLSPLYTKLVKQYRR